MADKLTRQEADSLLRETWKATNKNQAIRVLAHSPAQLMVAENQAEGWKLLGQGIAGVVAEQDSKDGPRLALITLPKAGWPSSVLLSEKITQEMDYRADCTNDMFHHFVMQGKNAGFSFAQRDESKMFLEMVRLVIPAPSVPSLSSSSNTNNNNNNNNSLTVAKNCHAHHSNSSSVIHNNNSSNNSGVGKASPPGTVRSAVTPTPADEDGSSVRARAGTWTAASLRGVARPSLAALKAKTSAPVGVGQQTSPKPQHQQQQHQLSSPRLCGKQQAAAGSSTTLPNNTLSPPPLPPPPKSPGAASSPGSSPRSSRLLFPPGACASSSAGAADASARPVVRSPSMASLSVPASPAVADDPAKRFSLNESLASSSSSTTLSTSPQAERARSGTVSGAGLRPRSASNRGSGGGAAPPLPPPPLPPPPKNVVA